MGAPIVSAYCYCLEVAKTRHQIIESVENSGLSPFVRPFVPSIAKGSPGNARRLVGKLIDQCQRIGRSPLGYVSREDLAPGLRMGAVGRYVVFFRVLGGTVRIERVLHGSRNLPMLFGADKYTVPED